MASDDYGECYCGDRLTLRHECYHWPPRRCDCHPTTDTPVAWAQDILDALTAAEQERDRLLAERADWEAQEAKLERIVERLDASCLAAEARATRLEALEAAARAWVDARPHEGGPAGRTHQALIAAVAALDTPPAEPS